MADDDSKVYALNLFDVADREEYLAYSRRSAREVARHGGHVVALGRFRESVTGNITPRQVLILVEWESRAVLATSLLGDIAAAFREDGSATFDDEHCCYFRRPHWSAVTATCTVAASRTAR